MKIIPIKYVSISKYVSIRGGYRIFEVKAKDNSGFADLKIKGPFVGATLRF